MTSVLITGGAGYLGSVLTEVLLNKGYRVTVLDNLIYKQTSVAPFAYHPNFNFILGDVTNESTLKPLKNLHLNHFHYMLKLNVMLKKQY